MHFSANGIVVACRRVICHVFMCLLNLCDLLSVMHFSANGIVVACDRSCICVLFESL